MIYVRSSQNNKSVICSFVRNCFYGFLCAKLSGRNTFKVMKNDHFQSPKWSSFSYVFGQVRKWLILELHEMIRVVYVRACPVDFNLFCHLSKRLGVFKMLLF